MLGFAAERLRHHPRVGGLGRVAGDAVGDQLALRRQRAERFDAAVELAAAEVAAATADGGENGDSPARSRRHVACEGRRAARRPQPFLPATARCNWALFIFERPSMPRCLASL